MRMVSFHRLPEVYIYSSNLEHKTLLSEYTMMCYGAIMIQLNRGYHTVMMGCQRRAARELA